MNIFVHIGANFDEFGKWILGIILFVDTVI